MKANYEFKISTNSPTVGLYKITDSSDGHYLILDKLFDYMRSRGFEINNDEEVDKCIRKDYFIGRKKNLQFKSHRYPRGFSLEFYQNVNYENPNGGEYDFDKYDKMPYLIKLMFRNEANYIKCFLEHLGCTNATEVEYKNTKDIIKKRYVDCWHHPQKSMFEFELKDLDGQTADASYNNKDRDENTIYNGEVKYFRDRCNGRLYRGKAYHNLNNMWWVIINKFEYRNIASFEFFNPTKEDFKIRRKVKDRKPKSYLLRKEKLKESSNKELINELKRRGFKI